MDIKKTKINSVNHGHVEGLFEGVECDPTRYGSYRVVIKLSVPDTFMNSIGGVGRQHIKLMGFIREERVNQLNAIRQLREGDLLSVNYRYQDRRYMNASGVEVKQCKLLMTSYRVLQRGCADELLDSFPIQRAAQLRAAAPVAAEEAESSWWCTISPERRDVPWRFTLADGACHYNACNYGFVQGTLVKAASISENKNGSKSVSVTVRIPRGHCLVSDPRTFDELTLKAHVRSDDEAGSAFFEGLKAGDSLKVCYQLRGVNRGGCPTYVQRFVLISAERLPSQEGEARMVGAI